MAATLDSDIFASAKIGDVRMLLPAKATAKDILLTTSSQDILVSAWPELAAKNIYPRTDFYNDGLTERTTGGCYFGGQGGNRFSVFEETPGGKLRAINHGGYFESNDRGVTWGQTANSTVDPIGRPGYSPVGYPNGCFRRADGRIYSCFLSNDVDGDGLNNKQVSYSDDFGATWTFCFDEAGDSGSNTYIDMAWGGPVGAELLVGIQYNGRIWTSPGTSGGGFTQRVAGGGGSPPFNFGVRWYPQMGAAGMFVIACDDRIRYSADGITWTTVMLPANCRGTALTEWGPLGAVCYYREGTSNTSAGTFRASRSTDGVTWTPVNLDLPQNAAGDGAGAATNIDNISVVDGKYAIFYTHTNTGTSTHLMALTTDFATWLTVVTVISGPTTRYPFVCVFPDMILCCTGVGTSTYQRNTPGYQFQRVVTLPKIAIPGLTVTNSFAGGTQKLYLRGKN